MEIQLIPAYHRINIIQTLFLEYAAWSSSPLTLRSMQGELDCIGQKYALPDGRLYLAMAAQSPAGCVALRRFDAASCEMKRLYVRPQFRGAGIGFALCQQLIRDAKQIGYQYMLLDTLSTYHNALALYRRLGFQEVDPYYHNPHPDAVYLRLTL